MKPVLGWKLYGDGSAPPPGEVVRPDERLSWGRTVGLGAQHVVAMFGATFVFPVVMGLDPNLAIMMSGVATILFLLIVNGRVPSYLGTSASFVGAVAAIRASGGDTATVTGAILVAGLVLAASGLVIHLVGAQVVVRVFPPAVTGAVVMLIGFNLAPVVANNYWPHDQWVGLLTMVFVVLATVLLRGFLGRLAVLLGLAFGFALSWVLDAVAGPTSVPGPEAGTTVSALRVDLSAVTEAPWIGLPAFHAPEFSTSAILVALPAVIALIAENAGHVKAVEEMTREPLDPYMGRAILADGVATAMSSAVGGAPTTTYAENIGVMAATRVYSTAAYYVAAIVAILFGFSPKFGALIAATPEGVLGGISLVLYGMIGLLGAKIWLENRVDLANPVVLVPVSAGLVAGIGGVRLAITEDFAIEGIALGTLIVIAGYHALHRLAPEQLRPRATPPPAAGAGPGGTPVGRAEPGTPERSQGTGEEGRPQST
ncbi:uracil-xanthine permease family protein [Marinitenerispora sediminis]|uniref:Nitrate reductase n=1 Tax=Marinitenerispora sediminis TaxID=1931232 RepID=A0A368T5C8_9ACTN|nr:solute carrier family 23 protein [Marinitenerispora sediminis]RCV53290.1 nitrate reductase [Marinitenerispora sediminis]RCV54476.1 nitrate reductase [Marinitenerispora sediminis]RCV58506.1 nitrate reductase [Marinitenerispora sediminis]